MKKKILAFTFAVLLICTMAIPASASSYSLDGWYESSYWEIVDNCKTDSFSSLTLCDSSTYLLKSDVDVYGWISVYEDGVLVDFVDDVIMEVYGTPQVAASGTSGTTKVAITKIRCEHYVNGHIVYTTVVSAS